MIVKGKIEGILIKLDKKYQKALRSPDPYEAKLYAKLAIIEYGGWLEESLDHVVERSVKSKIKQNKYHQMLDEIIRNNYGFKYKNNFRKMIKPVIGLEKLEKLENFLEANGGVTTFENQLDLYWKARCDAAHKYVYGATENYDAPSLILSRLRSLYPILKAISKHLSK